MTGAREDLPGDVPSGRGGPGESQDRPLEAQASRGPRRPAGACVGSGVAVGSIESCGALLQYKAIARRAVGRTALRADPGRTTGPPTTPHRFPSTGAVEVGRPAAGGGSGRAAGHPSGSRLPRTALSRPFATQSSSKRPAPTLNVVTSFFATLGTIGAVQQRSCTTSWSPLV